MSEAGEAAWSTTSLRRCVSSCCEKADAEGQDISLLSDVQKSSFVTSALLSPKDDIDWLREREAFAAEGVEIARECDEDDEFRATRCLRVRISLAIWSFTLLNSCMR